MVFLALMTTHHDDTICALSTTPGTSALAVIRVSGTSAIAAVNSLFSKEIDIGSGRTVHYGTLLHNDELIDDVVVTVFRNPASFTGEDIVEISCHGSPYIQKRILEVLVQQGVRMANAGEFSMRAFLNGKMDLSQTEAVADLIASNSRTAHDVAIKQMRGGFSTEIAALREQLIHFVSLIELELDFSEEDVEFANREQLAELLQKVLNTVSSLSDSYSLGNVIKDGIPVAIVGVPNVGKSTLLNTLLNENKAIVSEVPGTTRDAIEDTLDIDGVLFRFIDTAGIRDTGDEVELIGIERTFDKVREASIILYLIDANSSDTNEINKLTEQFSDNLSPDKEMIVVANKMDLDAANETKFGAIENVCFISAINGNGVNELKHRLLNYHNLELLNNESNIVTNVRHYEALVNAKVALQTAQQGLESGLSQDLLATDIKSALHHLSAIIGDVGVEELLDSIFSKFCIGK